MKTHDCDPTLTDTQVLDFCRNGYIVLKGVVDEDVNRRASEFCAGDDHHEPTGILDEDWFVDGVILNTEAAGAVRCLLGAHFHVPVSRRVMTCVGRHCIANT